MATTLRLKSKKFEERLNHIPGGLDNAVRQAEERGLHKMFIVDVDCHQWEPFNLFVNYLSKEWRRVFDQTYKPDPEEDPYISGRVQGEGRLPYKKAIEFEWSFGKVKRPEIADGALTDMKKVSNGFIRASTPPEDVIATFTRRMVDIGIKRSIVLPTYMLSLGVDPRPEFEVAVANAYIDYMIDHFLGKYPEILTLIYAPSNSPEKAAELIDRVGSNKGIVGVMLSPWRKTLAGDDSWNPIYEAAQKKGLPICVHGDRHLGPPFDQFDKFLTMHALSFPFSLMLMLTSIVMEGVPERFPKLKFAFMEAGVSWIPFIMHRLDSEYIMRSSEAPLLKKLPSEYIKEFYFSSQPLDHIPPRELAPIFKSFNAEDHLMYASDYSHWDFDVPSVIYDLPFLSMNAKRKILGENAAKFFKIK